MFIAVNTSNAFDCTINHISIYIYLSIRDVHGNPSPWDSHGNGNQIACTNGNGKGMGMAQIRMGTLITNVFSFSHNFPPKSVFDLVDS